MLGFILSNICWEYIRNWLWAYIYELSILLHSIGSMLKLLPLLVGLSAPGEVLRGDVSFPTACAIASGGPTFNRAKVRGRWKRRRIGKQTPISRRPRGFFGHSNAPDGSRFILLVMMTCFTRLSTTVSVRT